MYTAQLRMCGGMYLIVFFVVITFCHHRYSFYIIHCIIQGEIIPAWWHWTEGRCRKVLQLRFFWKPNKWINDQYIKKSFWNQTNGWKIDKTNLEPDKSGWNQENLAQEKKNGRWQYLVQGGGTVYLARSNTFMIIALKMILANRRSTIGAYERWVK